MMRTGVYVVALICSLWQLGGTAQAETSLAPELLPGTVRVDAEQTVELMVNTPNLLVVDSRKEDQYLIGHIQGSINIPDTEMTRQVLRRYAPYRSTPLLFYCDGEQCLRSSRAATKALDWNYRSIYWFRGGWKEWVEKGMPISR